MNTLIQLQPTDLALALGMMAIAIGLSAWQGLGLEVSLAIATGRTLLQLLVVGYLLAVVFTWNNPWAILAVLAVMLTIAAIETRNWVVMRSRLPLGRSRVHQKEVPNLLPLPWGSIFVSTAITLSYTNLLVVRPET